MGQGGGQGGDLQHRVSQQHRVSALVTPNHPPPPPHLQHARQDLHHPEAVGGALLLPAVQDLLQWRDLRGSPSAWRPTLPAAGDGDTGSGALQQPLREYHVLATVHLILTRAISRIVLHISQMKYSFNAAFAVSANICLLEDLHQTNIVRVFFQRSS